MSGRVDWGSRDGNEVEAVIANLLYNEYGRAVRVRPGQGDFGIDIIVPATENSEPWDVYQVKKYAANLNSTQRTKIVESFSRLMIGLVREGLPINDWYLVTPLDPTVIKDLRGWFNDLPESAISSMRSPSPTTRKPSPVNGSTSPAARSCGRAFRSATVSQPSIGTSSTTTSTAGVTGFGMRPTPSRAS